MQTRSRRAWLWAVLLAAAALRLAGIRWGLPHAYNADEPHLVNLAVSFGGGSLRPYAFKYPTLWPYILFVAYGFYFVLLRLTGAIHGVADFIGLYGWNPTGFYLIGRLLAAASSLAAVAVMTRAGRRLGESVPWAAALLAVSPRLVESAHSLKPDSFMFLWVCAATFFALKILESGRRADLWRCGACLGLAMSSQFTALPACALLPLAWALSRRRAPARQLLEGVGLSAACFLAGSPYVLLDFHRFWFWVSMRDPAELAAMGPWSRLEVLRQVATNAWGFAGLGSLAGAAVLAGAGRLLARDRRLAALLLIPLALYVAVLSLNPDGGWPRYLFGAFPCLALLASEGLSLAPSGRALLTALIAATAVLPGLWKSASDDAVMRRPDTRAAAQDWIERNVPAGAVILADEPHAGPRLTVERSELLELADNARRSGSPRWRLFDGMAKTHPGGGYRILLLQRSARDLGTFHPKQVQLSQADQLVLDVGSGLEAARKARVDYVITSSYGATPEHSPELAPFFDALYREGRLAASFSPRPGATAGPTLRVFQLARSR